MQGSLLPTFKQLGYIMRYPKGDENGIYSPTNDYSASEIFMVCFPHAKYYIIYSYITLRLGLPLNIIVLQIWAEHCVYSLLCTVCLEERCTCEVPAEEVDSDWKTYKG